MKYITSSTYLRDIAKHVVSMRITVLVDDVAREGFISSTGIAVLVNADIAVLFDIGGTEEALEYNSKKLSVDLSSIDAVVISHAHYSHFSAYGLVAWEVPFIKTYIPYGTRDSLGLRLEKYSFKVVEVNNWTRISNKIFVTKPFTGPPVEHYLIVDRGSDLVVLTGCLHPGLRTLWEVMDHFSKPIGLLVGGLHLRNISEKEVKQFLSALLEDEKIGKIAPLHCTGNKARALLEAEYRGRYIDIRGGDVLKI